MNDMKATVVIQIFDYAAQEPGEDEVMVFRTSKSENEIVDSEGFLTKECYKLIKEKDLFLYENLCDEEYKVTYIPDSEIDILDF